MDRELLSSRDVTAAAMKRLVRRQETPVAMLEALRVALPLSCAVFDAEGTLLWLSERAERELGLALGENGSAHGEALDDWRAAARKHSGRDGDLSIDHVAARDGSMLTVVAWREHGISLALRTERARRGWRLTNRETETLMELARGNSNKAIAEILGCSLRTVEVHVSAILTKSRRSSRAELLATLLGHDPG
jgi:DNA-binding CsgD family transcriptional regulator